MMNLMGEDMDDQVKVQIPLDMLRDIRDVLAECSEDVESALAVEYPKAQREQYPSYARRWNNGMDVVRKAQTLRAALDQFYLMK